MLRVLILCFLIQNVYSQPTGESYSEIFKLLKEHRYQEAEAPLKKYLQDSRSPNPAAFVELGNIYYQKAVENFISDDDNITVVLLDSAVYAYQKAFSLFNEKNFKGNADLYRSLFKERKRDVKFGQVQNELDDRIKKINRKLNKLHRRNDSIATVNMRKEGKYTALIIGVSDYQNPELKLDKPVKDAEKLREVLTRDYTFNNRDIKFLANPTRQSVLKELVQLRKELSKRDNLLIFYAGHGYWDEDAQQGYWWPADASAEDPTYWLSNSDLRDQIRSIKTAHTLLISDACFSGGILKTRDAGEIRNAPADIILLYKHPSRRAMASGSLSAVPDQSVFFQYLLSTLENNTEKYISSQAIFDHIRKAVINNSMVVPQDGVILDTGDEGGDFIFIRKN
ncbi:MAG TPA: caspase family protein [Cyclobacteriaceae bacterium]|jgi:hypothetical protein|nr:caspase family protein [Cytophagales bacterium]HNT49847.1 caspase family protein [Cyclobacteriaceae bacterium]HRE66081.1 caspase family protein [Cyclobacteriaceae bacterium]HRF32228.1 caspase family protein [Cyclobacteriaceae bacterium]